ncbi:hypothetical protein ACOME3_004513 [Neoechinorhynchus agilis]
MIMKSTFGGGCFWCLEAFFKRIRGVHSVVPGYAGGSKPNPTYQEVCTGSTGHAEVIQITFDPQVLPFDKLLHVFFNTHNPTTLNRQGNDIGTQYRSIILYHDEQQRQAAVGARTSAQMDVGSNPIVTEITPLTAFYPAEKYHFNYFENNPCNQYCSLVIAEKLRKLCHQFRDIMEF